MTTKGKEITLKTGDEIEPDTREIQPPAILAPEEVEALKAQAIRKVRALVEASGSAEMEIADSMAGLGVSEQRDVAREFQLLKGRLGDLMAEPGAGKEIARSLTDLRTTLDEINPSEMSSRNPIARAFRAIPLLGTAKYPARLVKRIAIKYEPVSRQVAILEQRLQDGRGMLLRDNIELRKLYEGVEQQKPGLSRSAYLGELIKVELAAAVEKTEDPTEAERLRDVLHDVAMRVQDMRTMEEVSMQYMVSIEMSRQNNVRLSNAIERTLALGSNVVMIGLAIQMALSRQRRVMEANERTRAFLGNLIAANAEAVKRHTAEIGDAQNNPVVAIEKITQAHTDLVDAIETARQLRDQGVRISHENIGKLNTLIEHGGMTIPAVLSPDDRLMRRTAP